MLQRIFTLLCLAILLAATPMAARETDSCTAPTGQATHGPITINGNADLLVPGLPFIGNGVKSGSGTADDPYVIGPWHIKQGSGAPSPGASPAALHIRDVTAHVRIVDLTIEGSRAFPAPISLSNVQNIAFDGLWITGDWISSAINLVDVLNVTFKEVTFARDGTAETNTGFAFGNVDLAIQDVRSCGATNVASRVYGPVGNNSVDMSGVRTTSDQLMFLSVPGGRNVTLRDIQGHITIHSQLHDGGNVVVEDAEVAAISLQATGGAIQASVLNTTLHDPNKCDVTLGISIGAGAGSASLQGVKSWAHWDQEAILRAHAISVRNSTFDGRGDIGSCHPDPSPHPSLRPPVITISQWCGTCPPAQFSGNDVFGDAERIGLRTGEGRVVGTSNYFGDTTLEESGGSIALTDPRGRPHGQEGSEIPGPGVLYMMGAFAAALTAWRSGGRRGPPAP